MFRLLAHAKYSNGKIRAMHMHGVTYIVEALARFFTVNASHRITVEK